MAVIIRIILFLSDFFRKMMLLFYENYMRVVILTANLIPQDWHLKTQM